MPSPSPSTDFREPRPGTVFRDKKLYRFEWDEIEVLAAWPEIRGWVKSPYFSGWRHSRPPVRVVSGHLMKKISKLLLPRGEDQFVFPWAAPGENRRALCHLQWQDLIPSAVRARVARYRSRHFHLLSLFARSSYLGSELQPPLELEESSPALFFALASSWVFKSRPVKRPHRSIRALLAKKNQREMWAWLDYPSSKSVARMMRRIPAATVAIDRLLYLRAMLIAGSAAAARRLQHVDRLNAGVLRLLTDEDLSSTVPHRLLQEIAHDKKNDKNPLAAWVFRDCQILCAAMHLPAVRPQNISALAAVHDELLSRFNRDRDSRPSRKIEFAPPPVAGTKEIMPILNSVSLEAEGLEQQNCVGAYVARVLAQSSYIYKIKTAAERATLELLKRGKNTWIIGQLLCAGNRKVSRATRKTVTKWLQSSAAPGFTHTDDSGVT